MGRNRTPSNVLKMTGNPNKRPIKVEPIPPDEIPIPPLFLDEKEYSKMNNVLLTVIEIKENLENNINQ